MGINLITLSLHIHNARFVTAEKLQQTQMSRVMRKPTFWFPTWFDTNQAVQLQKMARGLKFRI